MKLLGSTLLLSACCALFACTNETADGSGTGGSASGGSASGGSASGGNSATGGGSADPTIPSDTSENGLKAFLDGKTYQAAPWVFDAAIRAGSVAGNPHGKVRVYFNPTAVASKDAGNGPFAMPAAEHTVGSTVVKELYDASDALIGRALEVKTGAGMRGTAWTYYCDGDGAACGADSGATLPIYGPGESTCEFCHGGDMFAPVP